MKESADGGRVALMNDDEAITWITGGQDEKVSPPQQRKRIRKKR